MLVTRERLYEETSRPPSQTGERTRDRRRPGSRLGRTCAPVPWGRARDERAGSGVGRVAIHVADRPPDDASLVCNSTRTATLHGSGTLGWARSMPATQRPTCRHRLVVLLATRSRLSDSGPFSISAPLAPELLPIRRAMSCAGRAPRSTRSPCVRGGRRSTTRRRIDRQESCTSGNRHRKIAGGFGVGRTRSPRRCAYLSDREIDRGFSAEPRDRAGNRSLSHG